MENYKLSNMSGKTIDIAKDEAEQESNIERLLSRKGARHIRERE